MADVKTQFDPREATERHSRALGMSGVLSRAVLSRGVKATSALLTHTRGARNVKKSPISSFLPAGSVPKKVAPVSRAILAMHSTCCVLRLGFLSAVIWYPLLIICRHHFSSIIICCLQRHPINIPIAYEANNMFLSLPVLQVVGAEPKTTREKIARDLVVAGSRMALSSSAADPSPFGLTHKQVGS